MVDAMLAREPRLAQPAVVATLWPGFTFFYPRLLARSGLAIGPEALEALRAP